MMRLAIFGGFVLALIPLCVGADEKKDVPKELEPFQGTWKVLEATHSGGQVPIEALAKLQFKFAGTKLTITEDERSDEGSYSIDAKKNPAEIDMINPAGKKVVGIFKFDKEGKLTLCFTKGEDAPRPKGFDEKESVMMVLEKVKK